MSSLKRKCNLSDDKQKCEIISYAKENPKLTQQQIADNLTIKWHHPIFRLNRQNKYHWMTFLRNSNYMYWHNIVFVLRERKQLFVKFILIYLFIKHVLFILMSLYKCKMYVSRVETIWESLSFHLITWLPVFNVSQFILPKYPLHRRWLFNEGSLYIYFHGSV
jgi:hypothetical protein